MKTYLIRSLKYLLWLVVLLFVIFVVMIATGTSRLGAEDTVTELFRTSQGQMMLCAIILLALWYPRFGFTRREVRANMPADRDVLIQTFRSRGFELVEEQGNRMIFKAGTLLKKIMLIWEDTIIVDVEDKYIVMDGIRKEVVRLEFRLKPVLGSSPEVAETEDEE